MGGLARRTLCALASLSLLSLAPAQSQLPISTSFLISDPATGDQDSPGVGMADDGRFVVVWKAGSNTAGDIFIRHYDSSGTPAAQFQLHQAGGANQLTPQVSSNAGGDWVSGWTTDQLGSARDLFGRRSSNNGATIGNEFALNAATAQDTTRPKVSRADDDSFVVAWQDFADLTDVHFRTFAADGTPAPTDSVANQASTASGTLGVSGFPNGSFVVSWTGYDTDNTGILARCFDTEGNAEGPEFHVNELDVGGQVGPAVASDARGAFVVVWRNGSTSGQYGMRLFDSDCTPRSGDLPVNDVTTGTRFGPIVDMAPDGAFVVAWAGTSQDADIGVSVREFTRSGVPVGGQFLPYSSQAGTQESPSVAIGKKTFVVVWADREGTSGIVDDVLGSRYRRRVVFTDDFESGALSYWTSSSP